MSEARRLIEGLLDAIAEVARSELAFPPVVIVQFGSTVSGEPKQITDIDLLFAFIDPPKSRFDRLRLVTPFDQAVTPFLLRLQALGTFIALSPLVVDSKTLDSLIPVFLDMPECSRIVFEREGMGVRFLENVKRLRDQERWTRSVLNGAPYWFKPRDSA